MSEDFLPSEDGADDTTAPLLSVKDLSVTFPTDDGDVRAVRNVSFDLHPGDVLGIVGESGSGKSVSSMAIMGLLPKNAIIDGSIRYRGEELNGRTYKEMQPFRSKHISMIFQDPMTSLNPVYTVGWQLAETYRAHHNVSKKAAWAKAIESLELVGIPQPDKRASQYPHEFSGGMRQRVVIAMAIINDPERDHRRRADHRARRDGAGADPRHHAAPAVRDRRGDRDDHARPRCGRGHGEPRAGDVRRHGGRVRPGRRRLREAADALHPRTARARCRTRPRWASGSRRSRARRPRWSTCRPAARSRRAARSSPTCATSGSPSWKRRARRTTGRAATAGSTSRRSTSPHRLFLHEEIGTIENPAAFAAANPDESLEVTAVHGSLLDEEIRP